MIVAGGGTGGHLFPGLAVAEQWAGTEPQSVLFVGSAFGIEARVIPQTRFAFRPLNIRGLRGRGWRGALGLAVQLPAAIATGLRILGQFRADVVLGVGGYASFPLVAAAWLRRVPAVLLEQNAHPGLANRALGHLARRVCTTFAAANAYFPAGKVVVTGNPVRAFAPPPAAPHHGFTLLVFGGSQGAHRLNLAMADAAAALFAAIPDLRVVHQTGAADREAIAARYAGLGVAAEALAFIDDMGAAYHRADLVVCRSGATTVAELTVLGKPAILVPYPFAADDHQRANAAVVAEQGAGVLLLDAECTGERLAAAVIELARDRAHLKAMGEAAQRLGVPDAAARVVATCREVVAGGGGGGG
ncbi:MAG TPA: undecaprenyldiphospho-muramoylpentapeptide beta-N-acetylglucosaminyltransferase [Candidatus Dormibacteraeota bacterium]|nr:undecaprenyldiphospho-muramoylpentapeptide beta-N-acetylglucosaminyltransferase [Candidatus Dormibacteraeota bacterium]